MKPVTIKAALPLIGFCLAFSGNPSRADSITLTGADLLASPYVTFPTTQPVLSGNSLIFGSGGTGFEKLMAVHLNQLSNYLSSTFSISLNLTRLPCSGLCAGQPDDWDPQILIGDGTNLLGFSLADNIQGSSAVQYRDAGNFGSDRSFSDIISGAGFPAIGESVDVNATFMVGTSETVINVSFLSGFGGHTFPISLDASAGLDLVLIRDNDTGEQYQINTVSLNVPAVPEPETYAMMLTGLGLVGFMTSRRKAA